MNEHDEPELTLPSGRRVLAAVAITLDDVRHSGRTVQISEAGELEIHPPTNVNAQWILESNWSDVVALLEADWHTTVH